MADKVQQVSKDLEGKFTVNLPKGQSLVRLLPGIGRVDFSTISLASAEALYKRGVKLLVKVEAKKPKKSPEETADSATKPK